MYLVSLGIQEGGDVVESIARRSTSQKGSRDDHKCRVSTFPHTLTRASQVHVIAKTLVLESEVRVGR
jgi:hypothetical protein